MYLCLLNLAVFFYHTKLAYIFLLCALQAVSVKKMVLIHFQDVFYLFLQTNSPFDNHIKYDASFSYKSKLKKMFKISKTLNMYSSKMQYTHNYSWRPNVNPKI